VYALSITIAVFVSGHNGQMFIPSSVSEVVVATVPVDTSE
jgi:hypothetical protein